MADFGKRLPLAGSAATSTALTSALFVRSNRPRTPLQCCLLAKVMDKFLHSLRRHWAAAGCPARPLSLRYNAWTSSLREGHPHISPPPTPEWRERNTTHHAWLFRAFGAWSVLLAFVHVAPLLTRRQSTKLLGLPSLDHCL